MHLDQHLLDLALQEFYAALFADLPKAKVTWTVFERQPIKLAITVKCRVSQAEAVAARLRDVTRITEVWTEQFPVEAHLALDPVVTIGHGGLVTTKISIFSHTLGD